MPAKTTWDTELYESRHSFVWQYGEGLLDLLAPKPGERILDLGCGTGQLTAKIADAGASVLGLDASPDMIGQARQNYPRLQFKLEDATATQFQSEFDAVFSNAALHWMLDAAAVAKNIARALKPGGRFVAELGGKGNIGQIMSSIEVALERHTGSVPPGRTYFPSIPEYTTLLEAEGLEVQLAHLYDRPTPLEGESGMEHWIRQFKWYYFENLPVAQRTAILAEVVAALRPKLFRDGVWFADYRRLRVVAIKPAG
jgi:trans-aconitate methyltransferase